MSNSTNKYTRSNRKKKNSSLQIFLVGLNLDLDLDLDSKSRFSGTEIVINCKVSLHSLHCITID